MKIEQKIETVGIINTSTPRLIPRTRRLFAVLVNAARHIEHWASTSTVVNSSSIPAASTINNNDRHPRKFITVPQSAPAPLAAPL
jgi:hypothetical protein